MLAHDVDKLRIALGRPHGREMADCPKAQADQPETEAKAKRGSQRAVEDGERARGAAEQDVLGQRPMNRDGEAWKLAAMSRPVGPQMSATPPTEKKQRQNRQSIA